MDGEPGAYSERVRRYILERALAPFGRSNEHFPMLDPWVSKLQEEVHKVIFGQCDGASSNGINSYDLFVMVGC